LNNMSTILLVLFSIIALMVLHEFGHFIVSKWFKVKVDEFGVGYPPRIFGKKIGETVYSLNLLPFGAFVKIAGEEGEKSINSSQNFNGKPIWQRSLIILGGVVSFWMIAVIILSFVFSSGISQVVSDEEEEGFSNPKIQVLSVASGSPAELAGIEIGDTILGFSAASVFYPVSKIKDVQEFTENYKGKEVVASMKRGVEDFEISLVPRVSPPEGEGAMGVSLIRTAEKSYPIWMAPGLAIKETINLTGAVIVGWGDTLLSLVKGQGLPSGVQFMGPVGMGSILNDAAKVGINYFLNIIAILSIYMAVMNLLPIPALDGGRLLFLAIEKIKRSPINPKIEQNVNSAFFYLLVALMVWVTIKDIGNLF